MTHFRQEYWSGLPFLPPRDIPNPWIESTSPVSPALQADSLPAASSGKPIKLGVSQIWPVGYSLHANLMYIHG